MWRGTGTRQSFDGLKKTVHTETHLSQKLMDLDRAFRETKLNQQRLHLLSMVPLKKDKPVLSGPATSAVGFQFRTQIAKIDALRIYALNDSCSLTPFSGLKADLDKLLLHANGSADTQIFGKPAGGAHFRHNLIQLLLFDDSDMTPDSI
jgi:hypothetical protein